LSNNETDAILGIVEEEITPHQIKRRNNYENIE